MKELRVRHRGATSRLLGIALFGIGSGFAPACVPAPSDCGAAPSHQRNAEDPAGQSINLQTALAAGRLHAVNREATVSNGGTAVRVTAAPGVGLVWIKDTAFAEGVIEADVCGRDVNAASFVGIAFHRKDEHTFEAVYLRPFNFAASTAERRRHAVQYVAEPDYPYARLRATFPEEFEHAVDPSVASSAWIPLRVVVHGGRVQVFVGQGHAASLDVRELRTAERGQVGLYVDNGSDGVFANVHIVHGA